MAVHQCALHRLKGLHLPYASVSHTPEHWAVSSQLWIHDAVMDVIGKAPGLQGLGPSTYILQAWDQRRALNSLDSVVTADSMGPISRCPLAPLVQGQQPHYPSYGTGGSPYDSQPQAPPPQYSNSYSHPAPPPPQHSPYSQVCISVPLNSAITCFEHEHIATRGRATAMRCDVTVDLKVLVYSTQAPPPSGVSSNPLWGGY